MELDLHRGVSVNPARAGMIPTSRSGVASFRGKPRASGDDPEFTDALVNRIG